MPNKSTPVRALPPTSARAMLTFSGVFKQAQSRPYTTGVVATVGFAGLLLLASGTSLKDTLLAMLLTLLVLSPLMALEVCCSTRNKDQVEPPLLSQP
jgi:hypothetical protein